MAIGIGVRRLRGLGLGTGWLKRSARPYCQRGDEQFVKRHKLALELVRDATRVSAVAGKIPG